MARLCPCASGRTAAVGAGESGTAVGCSLVGSAGAVVAGDSGRNGSSGAASPPPDAPLRTNGSSMSSKRSTAGRSTDPRIRSATFGFLRRSAPSPPSTAVARPILLGDRQHPDPHSGLDAPSAPRSSSVGLGHPVPAGAAAAAPGAATFISTASPLKRTSTATRSASRAVRPGRGERGELQRIHPGSRRPGYCSTRRAHFVEIFAEQRPKAAVRVAKSVRRRGSDRRLGRRDRAALERVVDRCLPSRAKARSHHPFRKSSRRRDRTWGFRPFAGADRVPRAKRRFRAGDVAGQAPPGPGGGTAAQRAVPAKETASLSTPTTSSG